jgi:hypothetical protein
MPVSALLTQESKERFDRTLERSMVDLKHWNQDYLLLGCVYLKLCYVLKCVI